MRMLYIRKPIEFGLLLLACILLSRQAYAQQLRISHSARSGVITCTGTYTNGELTVETCPSLISSSQPWSEVMTIETTATVSTVALPMDAGTAFFRVTQISYTNPPVDPTNAPSDNALIPGGTVNGTDPDFGSYALTIVNPVYMDRYEVTKELWDEVATWAATNGYDITPATGSGKGTDHPVQTVTWYDCVKWCNARSQKAGYRPAYYRTSAITTVYKTGVIDIEDDCVDWNDGYRLPTGEEWEYAARGGVQGRRFPFGADATHELANYFSSSSYPNDESLTRSFHPDYDFGAFPYTSPVGSLGSHGYGDGLFDMAGNVSEWCWDWYTQSTSREVRGGGWGSYSPLCRVAARADFTPTHTAYDLGFRTVLPQALMALR